MRRNLLMRHTSRNFVGNFFLDRNNFYAIFSNAGIYRIRGSIQLYFLAISRYFSKYFLRFSTTLYNGQNSLITSQFLKFDSFSISGSLFSLRQYLIILALSCLIVYVIHISVLWVFLYFFTGVSSIVFLETIITSLIHTIWCVITIILYSILCYPLSVLQLGYLMPYKWVYIPVLFSLFFGGILIIQLFWLNITSSYLLNNSARTTVLVLMWGIFLMGYIFFVVCLFLFVLLLQFPNYIPFRNFQQSQLKSKFENRFCDIFFQSTNPSSGNRFFGRIQKILKYPQLTNTLFNYRDTYNILTQLSFNKNYLWNSAPITTILKKTNTVDSLFGVFFFNESTTSLQKLVHIRGLGALGHFATGIVNNDQSLHSLQSGTTLLRACGYINYQLQVNFKFTHNFLKKLTPDNLSNFSNFPQFNVYVNWVQVYNNLGILIKPVENLGLVCGKTDCCTTITGAEILHFYTENNKLTYGSSPDTVTTDFFLEDYFFWWTITSTHFRDSTYLYRNLDIFL